LGWLKPTSEHAENNEIDQSMVTHWLEKMDVFIEQKVTASNCSTPNYIQQSL